MVTIVTRAGKGSALTWTEGDANLTNLNNGKLENVVEDTTPQLGGDLDVNGKSIVSASNGNIAIVPNGSGNIQLTPATGKITLGALDFPTGTGTNGYVLTTNGSSAMTWAAASGGGATTLNDLTDVVITAAATGDILRYNGTNWVDTAESSITVGTAGTVTLTADNSTDAINYPLFANAATGNISPRTDTGFTYSPSNGVLKSNYFDGIIGDTIFDGNSNQLSGPKLGYFTTATATKFTRTGDVSSSAFGMVGIGLGINSAGSASTFTDTGTAGTRANTYISVIRGGTLVATNAVTHTNATALYLESPVASTNTTITNNYALLTSGNVKVTGQVTGDNITSPLFNRVNSVASNAWTTSGIGYKSLAATFTDTTSTGTTAASYINVLDTTTFASTNVNTITEAANLYLGNAVQGTNTTITNAYSLITAGNVKVGGTVFGNFGAINNANLGYFSAQIRTGNLSQTSWSTTGIAFRNLASTFTDTTSTGTQAAKYVNIFDAPIVNHTNSVTVTDFVNLYVAAPTSGTNTTATNSWALLSNGRIKATGIDLQGANANTVISPTGTGTVAIQPAGTLTLGNASATTTFASSIIQANGTNQSISFSPSGTGAITLSSGAAGTINNMSIGATTKSTGAFTTLTADTTTLDDIRETVFAIGNSGATTLTPNAANGSVQTITATGNFTLSAFTSPVSGQTITFIITQDGVGSKTLTSTMKFAGGSKTLSTAANSIDILTVSYIGTTYYASLSKGFV